MISVIIPTYNEADCIAHTIKTVRERDVAQLVCEIIIADAGSTDTTALEVATAGATLVKSPRKGRAAQMNAGAAAARFPVLYFLHADSIPPHGFSSDIAAAVNSGCGSGCYRLAFDHPHWFLKLNCWFTRFNINSVRFGDQSLFMQREVFRKAGGFCEKHIVMEDQEIICRIRRHAKFKVLPRAVTTSARKYLQNGVVRLQAVFFCIWSLYKLGASQEQLVRTYRTLISQDKV